MPTRNAGASLRSCGLGATVREFLNASGLTGAEAPAHVTPAGSVPMFKFAPNIARCGSDEFVPRLHELRALVVSLFIMSGIAAAAFVACAVLP
jgi:hypothetical protein